MSFAPRVTVATVVEREGRFLMVEEAIDGRCVYNQPAGHLEAGEDLVQAARRETLEETAWTVEPWAVTGVLLWRHPGTGTTFLRTCFAARALRHHPHRDLDPAIRRVLWLRRDEVATLGGRLRSPMVLRCLDDYIAGRRAPLALLTAL